MKKLMVLATVAALAMVSSATTYRWQWSTSAAITDTNGKAATQTAYLLMGFASTTDANNAKKALLEDLRDGTYSESDITSHPDYSGQSKALSSGILETTSFTESNGGKQYAFAVIFDTKSDGSQYAYITGNAYDTGVASSGTGAGNLNLLTSKSDLYSIDDTSKTGVQQGWYQITEAAPEPTSGLLLLLGVGALALRRRRA